MYLQKPRSLSWRLDLSLAELQVLLTVVNIPLFRYVQYVCKLSSLLIFSCLLRHITLDSGLRLLPQSDVHFSFRIYVWEFLSLGSEIYSLGF